MGKTNVSSSRAPFSTAKALAPGDAAPSAFVLVDNQNDTCTVIGVDAAGNQVDISAVASISVASDDPGVLLVGAPSGMTFKMTAAGPLGSANVTVIATWNDGSVGPFNFTLPVSVVAGQATGVKIAPGTPVAN